MNPHRRRVAVVGSGISGLGAAWRLRERADVVLYEADARPGGHAWTVDVTRDGITHGVDVGFLVFNHRTYPNLVRLFDELDVPRAPSQMSFSVQVPAIGLEWSGNNLDTVFAQRRNLARPRFLGMLADLLRFNRLATRIAERNEETLLAQPIDEFLDAHGFGKAFRDWYLLPMLGCIWSCPTDQMMRFPVATMIRFCHNHGLIRVSDRPQWYTVRGGSRQYVQRIVAALPDVRLGCAVTGLRRIPPGSGEAGVWVDCAAGSERFDEVVLAGHSDQSLRLLGAGASAEERAVLGAIRYHRNQAVLHTDDRLLPRARKAWSAWNYERAPQAAREHGAVCLHYLINQLQPLPWTDPVLVSLNPVRAPHVESVLGTFEVWHPVFDAAAIQAQRRLPQIQGRAHVWFAGAWTRYGFHEDGLLSALNAVEAMTDRWQAERDRRSAA